MPGLRGFAAGVIAGAVLTVCLAPTARLLARVSAGEMPPGKKKLTAAEVAVLRRWIDSGARTATPEPEKIASRKPCNFTIAATRLSPRPTPGVFLILSER